MSHLDCVCRYLGIVTFPPGELRWIQDLTLLWNSTQSAIQWYKDMLSAAAVTTINCDGTYHGCGLKPGPARSCLQATSCQELLHHHHSRLCHNHLERTEHPMLLHPMLLLPLPFCLLPANPLLFFACSLAPRTSLISKLPSLLPSLTFSLRLPVLWCIQPGTESHEGPYFQLPQQSVCKIGAQ